MRNLFWGSVLHVLCLLDTSSWLSHKHFKFSLPKITDKLHPTSLLLIHSPHAQSPGLRTPRLPSLLPSKEMTHSLYFTPILFLTAFPHSAFCFGTFLSPTGALANNLPIGLPASSYFIFFSWNTSHRLILPKILLFLKTYNGSHGPPTG